LVASFDASGSADADGTVASYAWTFGDGSTGTGPNATRTYAAAGTYTVGLTVTDDKGATGTTSRSVTVTSPAAGTSFATDTFTRTVTGGFGTADTGGAWTTVGRAADLSVNGSTGRLQLAGAGAQNAAYLTSVSSNDTETALSLSVDKPATGGGVYVNVVGRRVGSDNYRTQVRFLSTGQVTVGVARTSGGSDVSLSTVTLPGSYVPGQVLMVRLQVSGTGTTALRAKVWASGTAEPAAWTVSANDTTASLQAAGSVGVIGYLSGSATNAPVVVSIDDLQVGPRR
jgi:PKD repeat protein